MIDKIQKFRKRRMNRILKRMDASPDGGRWVTTKDDNRVHINENGIPDKGNPYVIAAMTGKKPKTSTAYKQKQAQKLLHKGATLDLDELAEVLDSLPNGTLIKTKDISLKREGDHFVDQKTGHEWADGWDAGFQLKHNSTDKDVQFISPEEESKKPEEKQEVKDPSSVPSVDYSSQKKKIEDLVNMGDYAKVADYEYELYLLPKDTVITINNTKYQKINNNEWMDADTGEFLGESWDVGYKLKYNNSDKSLNITFPGETNNAFKKEAVSNVNNWITDYVQSELNGSKEPDPKALVDMLKSMSEGDYIESNNKKWVKSVDEYGDEVFVQGKQSFDPSYMKNLIYGKVMIGEDVHAGVGSEATQEKPKDTAKKYQATEQEMASQTANATNSSAFANVLHSEEAFTPERKSAAVWDKEDGRVADKTLRPVTASVWKTLDDNSKFALYAYTGSHYQDINEYLRSGESSFWDEGWRKNIEDETDRISKAIDQCEAPTDIWLQRGCSGHTLGKLFGVSETDFDNARSGGAKAIYDILSTSADYGQDPAFLSCGSSKNKGFDNKEVIMNIYCPKGTKMIYAEPFSKFGYGGKQDWDGESTQSYFSDEDETILQRGTMLVPRKVSMKGGKIFVDVDVIGQDY